MTLDQLDFEEMIALGQVHRENLDTGRWILGDLALAVSKKYGADNLGRFANETNIGKKSLQDYRAVSAFYDLSVRAEFSSIENLSYSHFKAAMRFKNLDAACAFLIECADKTYTVDLAQIEISKRLGKPVNPPKIGEYLGIVVAQDETGVTMRFNADSRLFSQDKSYKIVVYESELNQQPAKITNSQIWDIILNSVQADEKGENSNG